MNQSVIDRIRDLPSSFKREIENTGRPKWYCGSWAWSNKEKGELRPFFCGSARCPRERCSDIFWWRRIQRIRVAMEYLHRPPSSPAKFFTLTYRETESDQDVWDNWNHPWNKFRTVIKRKYGEFEFINVLEKHKQNDRPHIHGVTSLWIPQKDLSNRWSAVGGGDIVWIEGVKDDDIADYFGKDLKLAGYFGKDNMTQACVRQRRRTIFASRGVTSWEKVQKELTKSTDDWRLVKEEVYRDGKQIDLLLDSP